MLETYENDQLVSRFYTGEQCGDPVLPHTGVSDFIWPASVAGIALIILGGIAVFGEWLKDRQG